MKWEETGESRGGEACNHFFKRPIPAYQLVYQLLAGIPYDWSDLTDYIKSALSKRVVPVTQKDGMRLPRAWR